MRRILVSGACAFGLAGCADFDLGNLGGEVAPVQQAALLGGAVDVAGPEGYCVDLADSRLSRGFALLAACETLGLDDIPTPLSAGIITVQAGRSGTAAVAGSEPVLASLLESEAGAALLSDAEGGVTVLGTSTADNKVIVQFEDSDGAPIAGTQDAAWRAFVDIDGRLVTISARGLAAQPLGSNAGEQLLEAAVAAMLTANGSES